MKRYWPLYALILITILEGIALTSAVRGGFYTWMHFFEGAFFCQFATLKIFHPSDFAEGFKKYDLLAKAFSPYAYIYPFIELALGLAYLTVAPSIAIYIITVVIMGIGAIGVVKALKQGFDVRCACMGTVLDVPLSTVTLSEDIGMGLMALWMLLASL